ncbi:bacillithiol biosynthesis protein BshC, partial [Staphylococcus pasteuri_A]
EGPALANIERLQQPEAVTVVAGQQAGLLTGPLYTINKAISVIKLAAEKERKLGVPVIPIFWVAGEDHDYHEVNHIYSYD